MRNSLAKTAMLKRQQAGNVPINFQQFNRGAFRREAFINAAELENSMERENEDPNAGASFRFYLFLGLIGVVLFMLGAKYFEEQTITIPKVGLQLPGGDGASYSASGGGDGGGGIAADNQAYINEMLAKAGVSGKSAEALKTAVPADEPEPVDAPTGATAAGAAAKKPKKPTKEQEELEQQREELLLRKYQARKDMERNLKQMQKELDAQAEIDKTAVANYRSVEGAVASIRAEVDVELVTKVLGAKDVEEFRKMSDKDIGEKAKERKEEIEKKYAEKPELKEMHLAHLHDAVETLRNKDARTYYLMYGKLPPQYVMYVKSTHGGWGQELALKTFRNRLIMSILQHFNADWLDFTVIGLVLGVGYLIPMIFTVPKAIQIAQGMVDEYEKMEMLDEEAKKAAAGGGGSS